MRYIGELSSETEATKFTSFLIVNDIDSMTEASDGSWHIWVKDEDKTTVARARFDEFQADPAHPRYGQAVAEAEVVAKKSAEKLAESQRNTVQLAQKWGQAPSLGGRLGPRPVFVQTIIVVAISVTLFTSFGKSTAGLGREMLESLSFARYADIVKVDGSPTASIRSGQVWRTLTPIFLHFDVQHILFNCLMFYMFGRQIEWERGAYFLAWFVVVVGVAGNLGQGLVQPLLTGEFVPFGGLSGVVYGVFGYIWICSRTGQGRYFMSDLMVFVMLAFFVLGWMGELGMVDFMENIANWGHTLGLFAGMAWAMRGAK
jgi:GlpG protein